MRRQNNKSRQESKEENVINAGNMQIDIDSRRVLIDGKEVNLTAKEFDILEFLASNPGKVCLLYTSPSPRDS